jgi:hypothetical protein
MDLASKSTGAIRLANYHLQLLVFGESGTGKTTFAASFPKPFFLDFDKGVLSLAGREEVYSESFKAASYGSMDEAGRQLSPQAEFARFQKTVRDLIPHIKAGEIQTIVLDSITTYADLCLNYVLETGMTSKDKSNRLGQQPGIADWGMQMSIIKSTMNQLFALPCHFVATAHEQFEKDELTGALKGTPLATGKLAAQLPLWFDEVYRSNIQGQGTQARYVLSTKGSQGWVGKSRLDGLLKNCGKEGLPNPIGPDYTKISSFVEEAQKALDGKGGAPQPTT